MYSPIPESVQIHSSVTPLTRASERDTSAGLTAASATAW